MTTSVIRCAGRADIAVRALDLAIDGLRAAVRLRGEAHMALTGGSSATALFELLRSDERARRVEWDRVHVWQGDERFVAHEHADSNWAGALRDWLAQPDAPAIAEARRHPIPVAEAIAAGEDADWAALRYAAEIERVLPQRLGVPAFDVVLLGVGSDGHILSTFPGTQPIQEEQQAALAVAAPSHIEPRVPRVTLAPFLLRSSGLIVVMVPGAGKADVLAEVFGSALDRDRLPAQLALRPNAAWILDADSASLLDARGRQP